MSDQSAAINTNAQGPAEAEQDGTRVRQYSIRDQVEADRYAASRAAHARGSTGLRFLKVKPPGAV